jgi:hypothetical protein
MTTFPLPFGHRSTPGLIPAREQPPAEAGIDPAFDDDAEELEEQFAALRRLTV